MSIYRELVDSSRSQAVARSREPGLLEGYRSFTPSGRWNSLRREVDWCRKAIRGIRARARD